jgi:hypothetical protein
VTIKPEHSFLNAAFLEAMDEIGAYGFGVYGELPRRREDHRNPERVTTIEILQHARDHFLAYALNTPHDHFQTRRHQLAAVAFNAMMEFQFAGLENEA